MVSSIKEYLLHKKLQRQFPGVKIHQPVIFDRATLEKNLISCAEGVEILPGARIVGKVMLGRYSYFSFGVEAYASEEYPISIGHFVSIATGVCLISSHHHHSETIANFPLQERVFGQNDMPNGASIVIGSDVWIGAKAVILPGVTIGDGAIIGAGAIVTSGTTIKPYEVWVGNPAKKIKDRFPAEAMERMRMMSWWEWDIDEIKKNKDMFGKPVI